MADRAAVKRAKDLAAAVNKKLGVNVVKMGSDEKFEVRFIPTGVEPIDFLLGGGIPRGRFTTLTGDFSTLKSYIGYCAIAEVQKLGEEAVLIDTEHSYDKKWAKQCGVDTQALIVLRPENGELAIEAAESCIRAGVSLIVFDSVAASLPQAELNKRLHSENIQPARIAALMSAAMRRLTTANDDTAVLWINQLREGIGIMFGDPKKATGGMALPYYSSYIVNLKKVGNITRDIKSYGGDKYRTTKEKIGQQYKAELQKSKLSKPWREVWFDWSLEDNQIDVVGFLINQGVDAGLIKFKKADWQFPSQGIKISGREKFKDKIVSMYNEDQSVLDEIRALAATRGLPGTPDADIKPLSKPAKKSVAKKAAAKPAAKKSLKKSLKK